MTSAVLKINSGLSADSKRLLTDGVVRLMAEHLAVPLGNVQVVLEEIPAAPCRNDTSVAAASSAYLAKATAMLLAN